MNEEALKLGNRHLVRTEDGPKMQLGEGAVVCIKCAATIAGTVAGQHTLWMLTNLLARQFGVISELQIDAPEVPLMPNVAVFGQSTDLKSTLLKTARMIVGSAMNVRGDSDERAKVCIHVGKANTDAGISVIGEGWKAFLGKPSSAPDFTPARTEPLGPYFAACLGAGRVFTELTQINARNRPTPSRYVVSLWDCDEADNWDGVRQGPMVETWNLKPFYLIGAGAVGQALLITLRTLPGAVGKCVVIDFDPIDGPNLNRYPLATQDRIEASKPGLAAELCSTEQFCCVPYDGKWPAYAFDSKRQKVSALTESEQAWRFELMVSCVDRNVGRHGIQNFWPRLILGGSTHGMSLQATIYDMTTDGECLKCANPINETETTVEQEVERWRQMSAEERRVTAERLGLDLAAIERYLANPRCGELGEQEIGKYRLLRGQQWSVGFVSVAAGVVLASRLLRLSRGGVSSAFPAHKGNALRFNFVNPRTIFTRHLRRASCECAGEGKVHFNKLWQMTPSQPN